MMSDTPTHTEIVYGDLLCQFMRVCRSGDDSMRDRLFKAIEVFEELWPEDTARWRERFTHKRSPT